MTQKKSNYCPIIGGLCPIVPEVSTVVDGIDSALMLRIPNTGSLNSNSVSVFPFEYVAKI
jgi:hypothetical protein